MENITIQLSEETLLSMAESAVERQVSELMDNSFERTFHKTMEKKLNDIIEPIIATKAEEIVTSCLEKSTFEIHESGIGTHIISLQDKMEKAIHKYLIQKVDSYNREDSYGSNVKSRIDWAVEKLISNAFEKKIGEIISASAKSIEEQLNKIGSDKLQSEISTLIKRLIVKA